MTDNKNTGIQATPISVQLIDVFDRHRVSFSAVTQQINSATSMGRLMLSVLLSFAQFEREVTGERIRDKIAASKAKGMWMGGPLHVAAGESADPTAPRARALAGRAAWPTGPRWARLGHS